MNIYLKLLLGILVCVIAYLALRKPQKPNRRPRVYIAGPYSTGSPQENTDRAIDVADQIVDLGADPFIPHLFHYRHARRERPYQFWIDEDLRWLEVCDALFRFPGKSSGAENEITVMRDTHHRPVFYDLESLEAWIDEWNGENTHEH